MTGIETSRLYRMSSSGSDLLDPKPSVSAEPRANILVVDDRPNNLLAMEAILNGLGQKLTKARSGEEALRFLLLEDFAVILMDVQMPGLDGFETARLIRDRKRSRHTPIIFITAFEKDDLQVFKAYSLGAVDYLFKPVLPEVVRSKVAVFVELFKKTEQIKRQAELLVQMEQRESERRIAEEKHRWEMDRLRAERAQEKKIAEALTQRAEELERSMAERERAETRLKTSLQEKEVLLREIHHRVKNNLQVIASLLNLQSKYIKDPQALGMFVESRNRVKSMAIIHEKMYQSKDLARIDFADYVRNLAAGLCRSYRIESDSVALTVDVADVHLSVDTAIPCGLIINELVSNSLKHAFPEGRTGEIAIGLRPAGADRYVLTVRDNGDGFPKNLDVHNSTTLGLQIVSALTKQLEGTIEVTSAGGTTFQIIFTELKYKERG